MGFLQLLFTNGHPFAVWINGEQWAFMDGDSVTVKTPMLVEDRRKYGRTWWMHPGEKWVAKDGCLELQKEEETK